VGADPALQAVLRLEDLARDRRGRPFRAAQRLDQPGCAARAGGLAS